MKSLSVRLRPDKLEYFVGQEHFFYDGSLFYNSIKNKTFKSAIFFGPSGTGKTTLARIIAKSVNSDFFEINASETGTKELKEVLGTAKDKFFSLREEITFLYVDEFHRWNKLQQDSLLKSLEEGAVKFIGSTTENPYFSINDAILSRVGRIYEFRKLSDSNLKTVLKRALSDTEFGLGNIKKSIDEDAVDLLSEISNGDLRYALDSLEFIFNNSNDDKITSKTVKEACQRAKGTFHKSEDYYNLLSALQKSVRGSDPDAAVFYLAKLIDGGCDLKSISRRILVMASEDVSLAYPMAITVVNSCVSAAEKVGFPEARIHLSQAVCLLASCPKSNKTYLAVDKALSDIQNKTIDEMPAHIMDSHYSGAKSLGRGKDYLYPHNFGGYVKQQYLPDNISDVKYYEPTDNGKEKFFKSYLEGLKKL